MSKIAKAVNPLTTFQAIIFCDVTSETFNVQPNMTFAALKLDPVMPYCASDLSQTACWVVFDSHQNEH
jgi:hypothetical protein